MTGLCVIPGCRIRGRHRSTCDGECSGCLPRATDGNACETCAARAAGHLAVIVELTPDARAVAHRQSRRTAGGGSRSKPGSSPPIDLDATERLDEIQNSLTGWARHVAGERGVGMPFAGGTDLDQIVLCAEWLSRHLEWLRHRREVAEFMGDIAAAARRITGIINGPIPGRYAGPCSALVDDPDQPCPVDCACHNGPYYECDEPGGCGSVGCGRRICGQDVTSRPGSNDAACQACGARYDVDEQQKWMRGQIEDHLAEPVEIAGVLLRLGFPVGYSTIAAYAAKGQLVAHGHDEKGRALFRIGDVLDLRMAATKRVRRSTRSTESR